MDVSVRLFAARGYDNVTVQDIAAEMDGLTKGTIYHHFKGKEDILEALIDRVLVVDNIFERIDSDDTLTGLEKIRKVIDWSALDQGQTEISKIALSVLDTPNFLRRQIHNCVDVYARHIQRYIELGNRDGSMDVPYRQQAAESFMLLMNIWLNPSIFLQSLGGIISKVKYLRRLFDGIGLPVIDEETEGHLISFFEKMLAP